MAWGNASKSSQEHRYGPAVPLHLSPGGRNRIGTSARSLGQRGSALSDSFFGKKSPPWTRPA
eukprot:1186585-Prorocentrum_minimum.AAC.2